MNTEYERRRFGRRSRAIDTTGTVVDDAVASEVKNRLAEILDAGSNDLRKCHQELAGISQGGVAPMKSVEQFRTAAPDRIATEIDYTVLRHPAPGSVTGSVVNIYQSYGIVQTGSNSSATFSINFGPEEHRVITKAIEAVRDAISQSSSLNPIVCNQVEELIANLENEIKRTQPDIYTARGALQGLATIVQIIGSFPGVYQVIKGAAALLGLQLS